MIIERKELLDVLETIKAALAGKSPIVGLDHLWFNNNRAFAYNGVICIDAPFNLDFEGGLLGDLFVKFISSCRTDDIKFEKTNKNVVVSSGRAHITLPILTSDKSARDFPNFAVLESGSVINGAFTAALTNNLISVNKTSALAAYSGILLVEDTNNKINMFSTDSKSLTWEKVETFCDMEGSKILLPGEFCTQLLKLVDEDGTLLLDEGYAAFLSKDEISLTSRLLDSDGAPNYLSALRKHLTRASGYCLIPEDLKYVLERVDLVKLDRDNEPVTLSIRDNVIDISIQTPIGAVKDQSELNQPHEDITVTIDSSLILRALPRYKEFTVTEGAFIMRNNEDSYHLISTMQS